jgi:hypothetical protein
MVWIFLAEDREQWPALKNGNETLVSIKFFWKFLSSYSKKTQSHGELVI